MPDLVYHTPDRVQITLEGGTDGWTKGQGGNRLLKPFPETAT
jgi:hypothetical protein